MKKEMPQGVIIGAVVVVVLLVLGMGWKMLTSDGNPPREQTKPSDVKADPIPAIPGRAPKQVITRSGAPGG